jgi:hypothetical protein
LEFDAARERHTIDVRRDLSMAWHIEALHRQERLMPLSRLLGVAPQQASVMDQKAALMTLSEQTGIPLRQGKKGKKAKK